MMQAISFRLILHSYCSGPVLTVSVHTNHIKMVTDYCTNSAQLPTDEHECVMDISICYSLPGLQK